MPIAIYGLEKVNPSEGIRTLYKVKDELYLFTGLHGDSYGNLALDRSNNKVERVSLWVLRNYLELAYGISYLATVILTPCHPKVVYHFNMSSLLKYNFLIYEKAKDGSVHLCTMFTERGDTFLALEAKEKDQTFSFPLYLDDYKLCTAKQFANDFPKE